MRWVSIWVRRCFIWSVAEGKHAVWQCRNEIAYNSIILSVERFPHREWGGFDEWYVFEFSCNLSQIWQRNVVEVPLTKNTISVFGLFLGFALHRLKMEEIVNLIWEQIEWIHPESYVANGDVYGYFCQV
jgi:hypothetical protein